MGLFELIISFLEVVLQELSEIQRTKKIYKIKNHSTIQNIYKILTVIFTVINILFFIKLL